MLCCRSRRFLTIFGLSYERGCDVEDKMMKDIIINIITI